MVGYVTLNNRYTSGGFDVVLPFWLRAVSHILYSLIFIITLTPIVACARRRLLPPLLPAQSVVSHGILTV